MLGYSCHKAVPSPFTKCTGCPVRLNFKFNRKDQTYQRCARVITRHNHAPKIDSGKFIKRHDILEETKIYLQAGLTPNMIVQCLNKKFSLDLTKGQI